VVTFDSSAQGTSAAEWAADDRLRLLAPRSDEPIDRLIETVDELIVVAAHPDDESLGAGGLIATCATRGIRVRVFVVTDGAASHPESPTRTPSQIARDRAAEITEAVSYLDPRARVVRLGFADGGTDRDRDQIRAELSHAIESADGPIVIAAPFRGDGHRDHRIVGELCAELAEKHGHSLLEYPIWLWHWAHPGETTVPYEDLVALPLGPAEIEAKARAIAAHATQVAALSGEPGDERVLRPELLEHFQHSTEFFVHTTPVKTTSSLDATYFDELYDRHDDPWQFTSRWYERRKRALTLASLPAERFSSALELGCSIGVLTSELATRVDQLLAIDVSQSAVDRASERLQGTAGVSIRRADAAAGLPEGDFDLIVLSEVGYYLDRPALRTMLGQIRDRLASSSHELAVLVACHWRHPVVDYPLSGDDVHAAIAEVDGLSRLGRHEEADFVLEVFSTDGRSVAEREGLA
jgi:LmbE family N-acetylglucosaminyl deacetylase